MLSSGTTDYEGPQLTSFSIDRNSVDVSSAAQEVVFRAQATDPSGVSWDDSRVMIRFDKPDGGLDQKSAVFDSQGVARLELTKDNFGGTWSIQSIYLRDGKGNASYVWTEDLGEYGQACRKALG